MVKVWSDSKLPFVTFIIVARNEEQFLGTLLNDYLQQDYPSHLRELIIVDGYSDDGTKKIALTFARAHTELAITIYDNPQRIQAPGINLALQAARGDLVCRVDAHVSIPPDYLTKGVRLLIDQNHNGVVCVGGPWHTVGLGFWGRAIAAVLSTPFGVGNAKFRYAKTPGFVDTVPCGFFWKWVYDEVGLYKEDLVRSEDNELHARIRARGWKFYLSPELETTYFCRSSIRSFLQQAFGNGYWSLITWRQSSWRHLVPFAFVGTLFILGCGSLIWAPFSHILWTLGAIYGLMAFYYAFQVADRGTEWSSLLVIPVLFFLLHTTYGIGSWWALVSKKPDID
jgi:glycosyltransferase involved in cell wall biosynthesis